MGTFNLLPVSDSQNTGWTLVNAATLSAAWDDDDDTTYAKAPGYSGLAEVAFPTNTTSVPEGAVIDSVTVFLRANLTTAPGPLTIVTATTVTLRSVDNQSRMISRTVYPDNPISTIEVGTFPTDPTGVAWDVHRLNQLRSGVYTVPRGVADAIRVYKLMVRVNYRVRPETVVLSPVGTSTPSPTVQWAYIHAEADAEEFTEWKVFTQAQTQAVGFDPEVATPVEFGVTEPGVTSAILFEPLTPGVYSIYMRGKSVYGAYALWDSSEFTVYGPFPGIPGSDDNSGPYGAGVISVVEDSYAGAAHLTLRDSSNLLSVQQADFDATDDPLQFIPTNCTQARDTVNVYTLGSGSLRLTASSAGTMSTTSSFVEVAPSTPFTIRCQVRSAVTARTVTLSVQFYTDQYVTVGSAVTDVDTDSATTWKELVATGTVPATAAYFKISFSVASAALSEVHYIDRLGFMYGANTPWSSGGHLSRNLLTSAQATADRAVSTDTTVRFSAANSASTVALVASSGTGAEGSFQYQMTYTGTSPSIAFRAAGTAFTATGTGNTITINKPATAVEGDLLVAFVTTDQSTSITVPTGWYTTPSADVGTHQLSVYKRTVGPADPASWEFYAGTAYTRCYARVVAYSGAANASDQFTASNARTDADGNQIHQTATVMCDVANAWRLTAFSVRNDVAGSFTDVNTTAPTIPPPPMFVGKGTIWKEANPTTSWTITRPTGVQSGDLMLAAVASPGGVTYTAPAGWTLVQSHIWPPDLAAYSVTRDLRISVFKRTAGASEPSSWTGTMSATGYPVISTSVAWRYCKDASLQFLNPSTDHNIAFSTNSTNTHTSGITSASSKAARVHFFATVGEVGSVSTASSSEDYKREGTHVANPTANPGGTEVAMNSFDSGDTPVSAGTHQKVMSAELPYQVGLVFSGIIYGIDTVPAPGADETSRSDAAVGASDPFIRLGVFDSGAVIPTGSTSVYGTFSETSDSVISWIGIIKPANAVQPGYVSAKLTDLVDISKVDPLVWTMADSKVSVVGHFLGSTVGTPHLTAEFYRANQRISTATATGAVFGTSVWTKSGAVFDLPEGTTHLRMIVSASDRAVSDTVSFDRLSISFGESLAWRDGTASVAHPMWSYPEIEYADDDGTGYGEWNVLPGLRLNPPEYDPATGIVTFVDHTIVPLHTRKYRARMISAGLAGDKFVSAYGPESEEVNVTAQNWWLKDISDPSKNVLLYVKREPIRVTTTNTATAFYPLGEDVAVVVGEGSKGDMFSLSMFARSEEYSVLKQLADARRTLFLQSDVDHAWWIRKVGDLEAEILDTSKRKTDPLRLVTMKYVQVRQED